ncbi:unnamed protein product [Mycena citricolor]|uniref:TPR-like protein n=1 Tax=Mycena citricolor TaxID=2018698 RepID=A0AAD2HRR7_9AGAR|nr:unnamed protein product [Mycena citricolor]
MESAGPSDSLTSDNSFYAQDLTFHQVHPPARPHGQLPHVSRPLSSADEAGPVPKKLRSTAPPGETDRPIKPLKGGVDELSKKVPALSRPIAGSSKSSGHASTTVPGTRRSTRLNSGTGKAAHVSKVGVAIPAGSCSPLMIQHTLTRDRRRIPTNHLRSRSMESDMEDEFQSPSPPAIANSPQSETSPSRHDPMLADAYEWELADFYVYDLTRQFATAARALALYNSPKCLVELEKLPPVHQKTPWVLAMIGRAHFEQLEYAKAERAFKALRSLQPYRLLDMEVYSTLLWYLQKHVELSFLAQELLSIEPRCPQAWIAVGNLFSLQKERAHALTCFRRAAQLDPRCAYAYTLSGHESVEEDLDKAINFFQSALRADSRHYNAWYGLGTCYLRMTKVRLAEYHYRKAMDIHPYNAVLVGCVGLAVERYDRGAALKLFDAAVKLAPENALVRYRRSKILIAVKRYPEAIQDLERLRNTAPEESNVVFQLAKAYRLVGNDVKFAATLAQARDMSPKSVAKLKKLLDTVKDDSADDRMDEG